MLNIQRMSMFVDQSDSECGPRQLDVSIYAVRVLCPIHAERNILYR